MKPRSNILSEWCRQHGYTLEIHPNPMSRAGAIGLRGASPFAQLCEDKIIAAISDDTDVLYSVTHEMAHGDLSPTASEVDVLAQQAALLVDLVRRLWP